MCETQSVFWGVAQTRAIGLDLQTGDVLVTLAVTLHGVAAVEERFGRHGHARTWRGGESTRLKQRTEAQPASQEVSVA